MRILFITILSLSVSLNGFTQNQHLIDSLRQELTNVIEDTNKVNTLNGLAVEYQRINLDTSLIYSEQALQLSTKLKYKEGMSYSYYNIGIVHYYHSDYDLTIKNWEAQLKITEELGDKQGLSSSFQNIGIVYDEQGSFDKAISYYLKSLKLYEELGNKQGMSDSYNNIGIVHKEQGSYNKAISYYLKSLKIYEELSKSSDLALSKEGKNGISATYNNIGVVHFSQGSYKKSVSYYLKSLEIYKELDDKKGMSNAFNNIGNVKKAQGNYDNANSYYLKSIEIREEIGYKNGLASSYRNMASLNLILADSFALNENQKIEYLNNSIMYGNKGYEIAKEIKAMPMENSVTKQLMDAYVKFGDYKKAIFFANIYMATNDSLYNEEQTKELASLEAKYKYEKQKAIDDAENEKLVAIEKEEKEKQIILTYSTAAGLGLVIVFLIFVFNRLKITRRQKRLIEEQKKEVEKQKTVIEVAHDQLEEKNTEIMDSITYAKRIQSAILPPSKLVKEYLKESFILYKPKDIVAGDFYWMHCLPAGREHKDGKVLFAAADCTGHGVPGAMVSVVCNNALNRSVREYGLTDPGKILDKTREIVIHEFEKSEEEVKDGMDIALCSLEFSDGKVRLQYAGANNPLWIINPNRKEWPKEVLPFGEDLGGAEIKANKQPIGKFDNPLPYTTHTFELEKGDSLYIFSDGYVDQFGGEKGKKFKAKAFRELLLGIQDKSMENQRLLIDETFENWRGELEQIDDVCVIGVKV